MPKKKMHKTRSEHSGAQKAEIRICACGCRKKINPTRSWQKYASAKCRKKAWNLSRVRVGELVEIRRRLAEHEKWLVKLEKSVGVLK
jgi:hypothetical protein